MPGVVICVEREESRIQNTPGFSLSQKLSHLKAIRDFDNEMSCWDSPAQVIAMLGDALLAFRQRKVLWDGQLRWESPRAAALA
jgi:hypothetical protein